MELAALIFSAVVAKKGIRRATQTISSLEKMRQPKKIGSNFGANFFIK
jgi:hypothetical protein